MKNFLAIIFVAIITINAFGQSFEEQQKEQYTELVWYSNMPQDVRKFFNQEKIKATYKINKDLNPFYLRADFDGDTKIDYALAVIESATDKKGILIYHPATKVLFILGAGRMIPNGYERDDMNWMDAWHVYDEKKVEQGVTDEKPPKLKGDAIYADKLESSSGIIYWDGKKYRWYQQGD